MNNPSKVLVVEDDPFLADLIVSDLSKLFPLAPLTVLGPAETFSQAVELLRTGQPDVVLLDIDLQGDKQAGIKLAHHINLTLKFISIIFVSGLPNGFDLAKLTAPCGFLRKPYDRQQLADQLELLLIRKSQSTLSETNNLDSSYSKLQQPDAIFVATAHGELTALPLEKLVLLEADGKTIRAYLNSQPYPVVFTSPGLKNFFQEHEQNLAPDFFQLSRKHIVCLSRIQQIKHNQLLLAHQISTTEVKTISLPIPQNGDAKNSLFKKLGKNIY
ncbi:LytR/AlgR family response regulator transcription factor [Cyclobacterium plantarum]|uniref:Response regulator transcription factor n=1 Tax=Cyclobacterium plantarum TaxID=2716263 RepID=A0ABX0H5W9_9BACT|nr:response regulator [Cyclobacterium plantarum]NHE55758.1 response regulator transcription factor [Cyclobacterium plantarum]